jgi:heat shock protein HtpX
LSTVTLAGLYALLGAALIAAVEFAGADLSLAVIVGIAIILIQFAIGPFLMDLSLRWLYRMDWVSPAELPDHLRLFIDRVCEQRNIRFPKFGVINDGAPQAFTYGHSPNNARIVISRGIYELLAPDETEAVVAHEIGHAVHWDMLLMTVAQLVPLIFYYLYRTLIRMRSSGRSKKGEGGRLIIAIGAYVLYIISEYVVLWFSRTREYHADRFSGTVTGNPSALANALVKIAYGLAGRDKAQDRDGASSSRGGKMEAISAMGIFDAGAAQALAIASYSETAQAARAVDKQSLKGAMRWDLWNPWAKWYELNSTHPLVANRLRYLSDQAVHMGQEPYVVFDKARPESYWDEFLVDMFIHLLPVVATAAFVLIATGDYFVGETPPENRLLLPLALALVGATLLLRFSFAYRSAYFPEMSVATLLKKVKVSAVRPVPCTLKGRVIGRGVPGYIFSEDFVMRDDTGIIFLDYRQPLAIWEWLFGLLKAGKYEDREVVVAGWYRRSPVPYVELKSIELHGEVSRSWVPILNRFSAIALLVGGFAWAAAVVIGVI